MLAIALLSVHSLATAQMGQLRYYPKDKRSIGELRERAEREYTDAIFALGYRNDAASIPLLRHLAETPIPSQDEIDKIAHRPKRPQNPSEGYRRAEKANNDATNKIVIDRRRSSSLAAKMALTRMGVQSYFDEFAMGSSTTSYAWKTTCIEALGYMNDKRAVKYLGPLLYQDSPPVAPAGWDDDVSLIPYNVSAGIALGNLLPDEEDAELKNVVKRDDPKNHQETLLAKQWLQWWERNKGGYTK